MRQYRGLTVDTKKWVYGYFFKIWERTYILWGTINDIPNMTEVIPETVGQFTGLHDKERSRFFPHGKEIYEGDIMDNERYGVMKVTWLNGEFYLWLEKDMESLSIMSAKRFEVIGDIHSNPELLKEAKCQ